jgi:hypothetical protein
MSKKKKVEEQVVSISPHEMLYIARDLNTRHQRGLMTLKQFKENMTNLNIAGNILSRSDEFDQLPEIKEMLIELASNIPDIK